VRALGNYLWVKRLFPMIGGVGSLFLFLGVARRSLEPRAVWIALAMFAVSDDLIYYSSELKQYPRMSRRPYFAFDGLTVAGRPPTARRLGGCAAGGAAIVWFSHPSAFVLAGVGTTLIVSAVVRREMRTALGLSLAALAWLASFAGVYAVSREQLGHSQGMWAFWHSAFRDATDLILGCDLATPPAPLPVREPARLLDAPGPGALGSDNAWPGSPTVVTPLAVRLPRRSRVAGGRSVFRRLRVDVAARPQAAGPTHGPVPVHAASGLPAPVSFPRPALALSRAGSAAPDR